MIPRPGEDARQMELAYMANGNKKWYITLDNSLAVLFRKSNIQLIYEQVIPPLGIYPRGIKVYVHIKTYMWIFTVNLFIIAKN